MRLGQRLSSRSEEVTSIILPRKRKSSSPESDSEHSQIKLSTKFFIAAIILDLIQLGIVYSLLKEQPTDFLIRFTDANCTSEFEFISNENILSKLVDDLHKKPEGHLAKQISNAFYDKPQHLFKQTCNMWQASCYLNNFQINTKTHLIDVFDLDQELECKEKIYPCAIVYESTYQLLTENFFLSGINIIISFKYMTSS
ncbi:hypothetical protein Ciccas_003178 [Cichlidogyrus casuarinus]|uniref:Uncharacterized protein n=1 Tax=Cichlidogyrus casuarinus TaxID=1844966 RepID=A0ABD2QF43_9PLAT